MSLDIYRVLDVVEGVIVYSELDKGVCKMESVL